MFQHVTKNLNNYARYYEPKIKTIAFVDPVPSGNALGIQLRNSGLRVIAIFTNRSYLESQYTISLKIFDKVIYLDSNNFNETVNQLKMLEIDRLYYGYERSVAIADELASILCPHYSNDPRSSIARCNKFEMHETLHKKKIPSVRHVKIGKELTDSHIYELEEWNSHYVIKPVLENGFNDLHVFQTCAEIRNFLKNAATHDEYVIQEFLEGDEYFVDVYNVSGKIYIGGIQRYQREVINNKPICFYTEVVSAESYVAQQLISYVKKVLSAVEFLNGFAHVELMMTKEGPRLIEINPRISGALGLNHKLFNACGITNQIDHLIAACGIVPFKQPNSKCYGRKVYLQTFTKRVMGKLNVKLLKTLKSFVECIQLQKEGAEINLPNTMNDQAGFVLLASKDENQVNEDYQQVFQWQNEGRLF